jgi:hypothetical protein
VISMHKPERTTGGLALGFLWDLDAAAPWRFGDAVPRACRWCGLNLDWDCGFLTCPICDFDEEF